MVPAPTVRSVSEDATVSEDASELRMATFRFARRLRAQRAVDTMSDGQYAVLGTLYAYGGHTLGELAERERVSAPSMNRTVNCLEEAGYLSRAVDANDRRKVRIEITDAGAAVVAETMRRRDAWLEGFLAELSPRERAALRAAMEIMRKGADR